MNKKKSHNPSKTSVKKKEKDTVDLFESIFSKKKESPIKTEVPPFKLEHPEPISSPSSPASNLKIIDDGLKFSKKVFNSSYSFDKLLKKINDYRGFSKKEKKILIAVCKELALDIDCFFLKKKFKKKSLFTEFFRDVAFNNIKEKNAGRVTMLKDGIITVIGLPKVKSGEIVWVSTKGGEKLRALVLNLNENNAQAILLGNEKLISQDAKVYSTGSLFSLSCSLSLFGKVLDGLGEPKKRQKILQETKILVEQKATGIIDREPVKIPLRTGIKSVDSLVPIGRGQRELIIGDRQTGKTSIALDTILNHVTLNSLFKYDTKRSKRNDLTQIVWFIYNAIGQKQSTVNQLWTVLKNKDANWFTSVVAATASESAPLQFLSPYTACTLGEYIRDILGGHCVVIYDDLSKHAVAYRQMSLLLRRPPGREAFPGDVFYVHSRLLERAGSLTSKKKQKRGTLTAFPVIETQAGDVSAYIPTNVISITDGQIFLETELFYKGIRPAINVGLSVSRVGSAAQPNIVKKVAGSLKMELAQFRELESFSKLGASLDENTQRLLQRGENVIEVLKQGLNSPLSTQEEVLGIYLAVGFSGKWANDVNRVINLEQSTKFSLNSKFRSKYSWLEIIRSFSPEFGLSSIYLVLNKFNNFVEMLGLNFLSLSSSIENINIKLLNIHPLFLLEDLFVLFLSQASRLQITSTVLALGNISFKNSISSIFNSLGKPLFFLFKLKQFKQHLNLRFFLSCFKNISKKTVTVKCTKFSKIFVSFYLKLNLIYNNNKKIFFNFLKKNARSIAKHLLLKFFVSAVCFNFKKLDKKKTRSSNIKKLFYSNFVISALSSIKIQLCSTSLVVRSFFYNFVEVLKKCDSLIYTGLNCKNTLGFFVYNFLYLKYKEFNVHYCDFGTIFKNYFFFKKSRKGLFFSTDSEYTFVLNKLSFFLFLLFAVK